MTTSEDDTTPVAVIQPSENTSTAANETMPTANNDTAKADNKT